MYAIVLTGGKQYRVTEGLRFEVEKLNLEADAVVELPVLMISDEGSIKIGADVAKATVSAKVITEGRGAKINIFKYKSKKNVRKRQGHRQPYTLLEVVSINA